MATVKTDPRANAVGMTLVSAEGHSLVISDETPEGEVLDVTYAINGVAVSEAVFKTATQVKMLELLRLLAPA